MCGRYSVTLPVEALARVFGFAERPNLAPRWNLAPTQQAPVVRLRDGGGIEDGGRRLVMLRWGLVPAWAKDVSMGATLINARAETVAEKPAFRGAFRKRRCLVPADGFYEWKAEGKVKQPWRIQRPDGAPFAFAGLWESWQPKEAGAAPLESFTIVTTDANATLAPVHHRMPVILTTAEAQARWLDPAAAPDALQALLTAAPDDFLTAFRVSTRVNSARVDDAACIAPAEPPAAPAAASVPATPRQRDLF